MTVLVFLLLAAATFATSVVTRNAWVAVAGLVLFAAACWTAERRTGN